MANPARTSSAPDASATADSCRRTHDSRPLISLFLPQSGHVYELTRQGFALFSFTFLLCGFDIFISGFFTAISDGRTSALMSFARNLLGIVFFLLTLPRMLGLSGVWLAVPAADVTALLFGTFLLVSRMREDLTNV